MTSKSPVRTCEDMDEQALSYAEIKALCAGNPLIAEKMGLDVEVAKLKMLKANHQSQIYRLEDNIRLNFPKQIEGTKATIEGYKSDAERLATNTVKALEGISPMTIGANSFSERKDAGAALIDACRTIKGIGPDKVGSYRGFEISISFDTNTKEYRCHLKGAMTHTTALGSDPVGNITRIDNVLERIPALHKDAESKLETLCSQMENAKAELSKPFPQEAVLAEKSARLVELDALLSLDGRDESPDEARNGEAPADRADAAVHTDISAVNAAPTKTPEPQQALPVPQQAAQLPKDTQTAPTAAFAVRSDVKPPEVKADTKVTGTDAKDVNAPIKKKSYDER